MASHDASVSVLMDRMSDIDKQRRVLRMRQKELEAKVDFATTEKTDLERESKAMDDEERQLKVDLETLVAEEQRLEVHTMEVNDHLRRTEEEEAVHTASANAELQSLAKEEKRWREKAEELEQLRRTWENDPATSSCVADLGREMELLNALRTEKASMEMQIMSVESTVEKLRAERQAQLASTGGLANDTSAAKNVTTATLLSLQVHRSSDPSSANTVVLPDEQSAAGVSAGDDTSAHSIAEEIKKVEYEWAQMTGRHTWAMSSLQREVDGLSSRAVELQELLSNVRASQQEVAQHAAQLEQCLASNRCLRCAS
jgi:predicted  nucleic acid-binding Zn-ribbon protein